MWGEEPGKAAGCFSTSRGQPHYPTCPTTIVSHGPNEPEPCCLPPTCTQPALAHLPLPNEGSQLLGPLVHQADVLDGVDQGFCIIWAGAEGKSLGDRTPKATTSPPALVS